MDLIWNYRLQKDFPDYITDFNDKTKKGQIRAVIWFKYFKN